MRPGQTGDAQQVLRPAGVGSFGPMKYALACKWDPATYQRPPHPDVTTSRKPRSKKLQQIKQMA